MISGDSIRNKEFSYGMTILILTHSYPDARNSYRGIFIKEQVKALGLMHNVIVVYFRVDYTHFDPFKKYSFTIKKDQQITEYEVITGRSFPVINQLKYLLDTYSFIRKEILANFKIDIIHSHLAYPAGFLGTVIYKRRNIPHVFTEHTTIWKYFRSYIHKLCVKYAIKNSPGIICVSKALGEEVRGLSDRKIFVVHNVIDSRKFIKAAPENGSSVNIGFLGGLGNANKGLDLLLKSVSLLSYKNIILHIGGKGRMLEDYIRMSEELGIGSICRFYGEIVPEKINDFYSKLNIFVLPSRYETFGIVLIEAMASGIPVIATKCGGPEEIVTTATGLLVSKDNIVELSEAISYMIRNLQQYKSSDIRSYVSNKFGQKAFLISISLVYENIIDAVKQK